jgi:hypothetical protein
MARMPRACQGNAISDQWYAVVSTTLAALCVGALGWIKVNLRARRDRVLRCISTVQCFAGDDAVDFCRKSAVFRKAGWWGDSPVRMFWKASSTLLASRAEVSMKDRLFSPEHVSVMPNVYDLLNALANCLASSVGTALRCRKSLLFPTSMMTIFESA